MGLFEKFFKFAEKAQVRIEGAEIEVFRAGDYGDNGAYSEADLAAIAGNFDPALHEPPITRNHEDKDGPHGVVSRLVAKGTSLFAVFASVAPDFKQWLEDHPYAKRSIEIYPAKASPNGKPMVRAVSFVAVPRVKGMAPLPTFSDERGEYKAIDFAEDGESEPSPARRLIETGKGGNGDHTHFVMVDAEGNGTTTGPIVCEGHEWPRQPKINPTGHTHEVKAYTVQPAEGHSHQLTVTTGKDDWTEDAPDDDTPYGLLYSESQGAFDDHCAAFADATPAKTEGGQKFTAGAYLHVPDPAKPSTWKLRIEEEPGKVSVAQLGKAAAALGKGFRGRQVQMDDKAMAAAMKKLRAAYKAQGVKPKDYPDILKMQEDGDMPEPITPTANLEELKKQLKAELAQEFSEKEKTLTAQVELLSRDNRRAAVRETLAKIEGLPPAIANKPGLAEFCEGLMAETAVLKFGEGDQAKEASRIGFFAELLGEALKLGAVPGKGEQVPSGPPAAPAGDQYAELHKRALKFQEEHKGATYADALLAVSPKN